MLGQVKIAIQGLPGHLACRQANAGQCIRKEETAGSFADKFKNESTERILKNKITLRRYENAQSVMLLFRAHGPQVGPLSPPHS